METENICPDCGADAPDDRLPCWKCGGDRLLAVDVVRAAAGAAWRAALFPGGVASHLVESTFGGHVRRRDVAVIAHPIDKASDPPVPAPPEEGSDVRGLLSPDGETAAAVARGDDDREP